MHTNKMIEIDGLVSNKFQLETDDAQYFEYTSSANPVGSGLINKVPYHSFNASLYEGAPTSLIPLDLSRELGCDYPATGPSLLAHFICITEGDKISLNPNATSMVFYVQEGGGEVAQGDELFSFAKGDFIALPGGREVFLAAEYTSLLYYVNDAPLLNYLGTTVSVARFAPTLYPVKRSMAMLKAVEQSPHAKKRNRISILLANARFPETRTITHSVWAMLGVVEPYSTQKPHRHQSIALDFIPDAQPGSYTLVGTELDDAGNILNPVRVDWVSGMVFVTPPGYWHAHFNESDEPAYVIPLQDAGLHTYLRSLDIHFA